MTLAQSNVSIRGPITRAAYAELPEGPPYYELIDGELTEMSPRPLERHQELLAAFVRELGTHVFAELGGRMVPEPNLYLPNTENVYQPDFVYVAREQLHIRRRGGIYGVPELVCEILSPSTERRDRGVKLEAFCRSGVPHIWLIEPEAPLSVEEFVLVSGNRYHSPAKTSAPTLWTPVAFPGWSLDLGAVQAEIALPEETEPDAD